jgi:hypothetical protein
VILKKNWHWFATSLILKNRRTCFDRCKLGSEKSKNWVTDLPYEPAVLCQFFEIFQKSQTTGSFDFENISMKPKPQEVLRFLENWQWPFTSPNLKDHRTRFDPYGFLKNQRTQSKSLPIMIDSLLLSWKLPVLWEFVKNPTTGCSLGSENISMYFCSR